MIKKIFSNEEFLEKCINIHGNVFDYSKTIYTGIKSKIEIICRIHGSFVLRSDKHLEGRGCSECSRIKKCKSLNNFIDSAKLLHKNKYDYQLVNYINNCTNIKIICNTHGVFEQRPDVHLQGAGCWKCSNCSSGIENDWLDYHNILPEERQITLKMNNTWYKVDAYVLKTNTIYEFYGDYWHGNPKIFLSTDINKCNKRLFGELYDKTINRENIFKNNNYNLITIWESDWV